MSDGEVLSPEEIQKILRVTPGDEAAEVRNRALLVALFGDGRRLKEIVGLTAAEAEWEDFAPDYREEVDAWLRRRGELGLERYGPVFSSPEGDPLTVAYVRGLAGRTRAKAAKLPDEILAEGAGPKPAAPEAEQEPPAEPEPEPEPEPPEP